MAPSQPVPNGQQLHPHPSLTIFFHLSRLGHKIQGVLCDGDSNEVVASTVVNCLKIDEGRMRKYSHNILFFVCFNRHFLTQTCHTLFTGTIAIVREGCVPAVKVQQIFDRVKSIMVWLSHTFKGPLHAWFPTRSASSAPTLPFSNLSNTLWTIWEKLSES